MNKALRKAIIAGNWKMNKNRKEAAELIEALKPIAADKTCGVIICVPFTNLETALRLTEGTNIEVGAENVHFEEKGAFTGRNFCRYADRNGRKVCYRWSLRKKTVLR